MEKRYLDSVFLRVVLETGDYWLDLPVVRWLARGNRLTFDSDVTFLVGEAGVTRATYQETAHYQFTRQFLEQPERMLRYLFEEDAL